MATEHDARAAVGLFRVEDTHLGRRVMFSIHPSRAWQCGIFRRR